MILLLLLILLAILWICMSTSKKNLLTPQFGFTVSFIFSVGYAIFSLDYIQLDLSFSTFIVILSGVAIFFVTSYIMEYILNRNKRYIYEISNEVYIEDVDNEPSLVISPLILCLYIVAELFVIYMYRAFYIRVTGISLFTEAMYIYRHTVMFTNEYVESISYYILFLRRFCVASGYIFSYVLIHSILYKYKSNKILLTINIVLVTFLNSLSGSRGPSVIYILSILIQVYLLNGNKQQWKKRTKLKIVFIGIVVALVLMYAFQLLGNLMGRSSTKTLADYLAVYVSAPIKNLDTFLKNGQFGSTISTNQTLVYVVNYFAKILGIASWTHTTDQPFRYNSYGYGLGNVYTTFYAFLYDARVLGLIFYTMLMSIISQIIMNKATKQWNSRRPRVRVSILVYSYMFPYLCMSFFSNKFYENIFNPLFGLYFCIWSSVPYFLFRIRFKSNRH